MFNVISHIKQILLNFLFRTMSKTHDGLEKVANIISICAKHCTAKCSSKFSEEKNCLLLLKMFLYTEHQRK